MTYAIADDVVFEVVDGEAVVLQMADGVYYQLSPVATTMWRELEKGPASVDDLVATLGGTYEVEPAVLAADLEAVLTDLQGYALVVRR